MDLPAGAGRLMLTLIGGILGVFVDGIHGSTTNIAAPWVQRVGLFTVATGRAVAGILVAKKGKKTRPKSKTSFFVGPL